MSRRPEYLVQMSQEYIQTTPGAEKELKVFADEMALTGNSDVVFRQIRDITLFGENGEMQKVKDMVPVLVLKPEMYKSIALVNKSGGKMYEESGLVETQVQ